MSDRDNIVRIKVVHAALEELGPKVVFVGGATVSLYKDRVVSETRVTDDVDIVVEIAAYTEFAEIEEKLRRKGFTNDFTSKVICRYVVKGVVVDIMPTKGDILGFTNPWYVNGVKHSITFQLDSRTEIRIFDAVHFLASKIAAFQNRGKKDGRISSDFEDIVYLLKSRDTLWRELEEAPEQIKQYLKMFFSELLENHYVHEWISVHLDFSEQKRVGYLITCIQKFIDSK